MICTSFNSVLCCIRRKSLMKRLVLLLNLCMIENGIVASGKVLIDNDHLAMYPYCGSMDYEDSQYSTGQSCQGCISRAANAQNSTSWYRWLIVLEMRNMKTNGMVEHYDCTGSVITNR